MGAIMAIYACGRRGAALGRPRVQAVCVRLLGIRVAIGTADLLGSGFVNHPFDIFVAINAGEDSTMDRMLELLAIDVQTHFLAICLRAERSVGVAGETVFIRRFVFRLGPDGQKKKQKSQCGYERSCCTGHANRRFLSGKFCGDTSHNEAVRRRLSGPVWSADRPRNSVRTVAEASISMELGENGAWAKGRTTYRKKRAIWNASSSSEGAVDAGNRVF